MKTILFACVLLFGFNLALAMVGQSCTSTTDCKSDREVCTSDDTTSPPVTTEETTSPFSTSEDSTALSTTYPSITTVEDSDSLPPRRRLLWRAQTRREEAGKCTCKEGYEESKDGKQCRISFSEEFSCEENIDCELLTTLSNYTYSLHTEPFCNDGTCACGDVEDWQVALYEDDAMCFKIPELEDNGYSCNYTQECFFLDDDFRNTTASCSTNDTCVCDSDDWQMFTNNNGTKCERVLGAECDNNEQCGHLEDSECRDNICHCKGGYTPDEEDKFKCSSGSSSVMISSTMMLVLVVLVKQVTSL